MINMFSTPMYEGIVKDNKCKKQLLSKLKNPTDMVKISNVGGVQTSPFTDDQLDKFLTKPFIEYTDNLNKRGYAKWKVLSYWINVNRKSNFNKPHAHVDSPIHFSGIWYLKAPKDCGNLVFLNPDKSLEVNNAFDFFDHSFAYADYTIIPEDNKLIIFPSNVTHYVEPNKSIEERISVAFNIGLYV